MFYLASISCYLNEHDFLQSISLSSIIGRKPNCSSPEARLKYIEKRILGKYIRTFETEGAVKVDAETGEVHYKQLLVDESCRCVKSSGRLGREAAQSTLASEKSGTSASDSGMLVEAGQNAKSTTSTRRIAALSPMIIESQIEVMDRLHNSDAGNQSPQENDDDRYEYQPSFEDYSDRSNQSGYAAARLPAPIESLLNTHAISSLTIEVCQQHIIEISKARFVYLKQCKESDHDLTSSEDILNIVDESFNYVLLKSQYNDLKEQLSVSKQQL